MIDGPPSRMIAAYTGNLNHDRTRIDRSRLRCFQPTEHRCRPSVDERAGHWPKASEGGRVVGKQAIRDYWTRQWVEYDPRVDVLEIVDGEAGTLDVKVHQLVKNVEGVVLSDTEVWHVYTFADGLIERMDVKEGEDSSDGQSAAFAQSDRTE